MTSETEQTKYQFYGYSPWRMSLRRITLRRASGNASHFLRFHAPRNMELAGILENLLPGVVGENATYTVRHGFRRATLRQIVNVGTLGATTTYPGGWFFPADQSRFLPHPSHVGVVYEDIFCNWFNSAGQYGARLTRVVADNLQSADFVAIPSQQTMLQKGLTAESCAAGYASVGYANYSLPSAGDILSAKFDGSVWSNELAYDAAWETGEILTAPSYVDLTTQAPSGWIVAAATNGVYGGNVRRTGTVSIDEDVVHPSLMDIILLPALGGSHTLQLSVTDANLDTAQSSPLSLDIESAVTVGASTALTWLVTRTTDDLPEGSGRLYYSNSRVDSRISQAIGSDIAPMVHTHDASALTTGTIPVERLGASGTRDNTSVLYGDNVWRTPSAGTVTPAGSSTEIQYNNAGVLGASAKFTWDNATTTLLISNNSNYLRFVDINDGSYHYHDIMASNGMRIGVGSGSMITGPVFQLFGDDFSGQEGQIYFDCGSHASAAVVFRTGGISTAVERLRIRHHGEATMYGDEPGDVVLGINGASSQTAPILECRNSVGAALFAVDANGYPILPVVNSNPPATSPADGAIVVSNVSGTERLYVRVNGAWKYMSLS